MDVGTFLRRQHPRTIETSSGIGMTKHAAAHPSSDEADLVARARCHDAAAVRLIIRQHNQRLYRIARSIVRDDAEAEDVLQESYARAFTNLATFRGEARLGTWLARIVMNEALGRLRGKRRTLELNSIIAGGALEAEIIPFPNANAELDPETAVAQRELRALLERAIDDLPESFRTVLVARLIEGMSIEETAELFGILPETVKTRLHRARRLLRDAMEKHIGPAMGDAFPFAGRRCERLAEGVLARLGLA
jgi:RNA polymerase sigma-70 factor (ECF subfamily)